MRDDLIVAIEETKRIELEREFFDLKRDYAQLLEDNARLVELLKMLDGHICHDDKCAWMRNHIYCDCGYDEIVRTIAKELGDG